MDEHDEVWLGLSLGFGSTEYEVRMDNPRKNDKQAFLLDLGAGEDDQKRGSKKKRWSDSSKLEQDDTNFSKNCSRKKLMLTRDQSTLLEQNFEHNSTINMVQKQALAEQLNLKPRQVEIWFQNRRARSKLKQTEIDYKLLKINYLKLSEENQRLKKELLELQMMKTESPPQPPRPPLFSGHSNN